MRVFKELDQIIGEAQDTELSNVFQFRTHILKTSCTEGTNWHVMSK